MSMKATVRSSSSTTVAGRSPATILQKMQSSSATGGMYTLRDLMPEATDARAEMEGAIRHLASIERASCSAGEHQAAEWIAGRLQARGLDARVEEESAHGTYWIPLGLLSAAGAAAGLGALRGRRALPAILGALAAAGVWTETEGGRQRFRRALLSRRRAWNVVAETGDAAADRIVV